MKLAIIYMVEPVWNEVIAMLNSHVLTAVMAPRQKRKRHWLTASQTVFGSSGSGNFLTRSTSVLAFVFFATSFSLAYLAKEKAVGLVDEGLPTVQEVAPVVETEVPVVETSTESEAPVID